MSMWSLEHVMWSRGETHTWGAIQIFVDHVVLLCQERRCMHGELSSLLGCCSQGSGGRGWGAILRCCSLRVR